jgi:hypothetical protein
MSNNAKAKRDIATIKDTFCETLVLNSIKCAVTKISVPMANRCGVATSISPSILLSAGAMRTFFSVLIIPSLHSNP